MTPGLEILVFCLLIAGSLAGMVYVLRVGGRDTQHFFIGGLNAGLALAALAQVIGYLLGAWELDFVGLAFRIAVLLITAILLNLLLAALIWIARRLDSHSR